MGGCDALALQEGDGLLNGGRGPSGQGRKTHTELVRTCCGGRPCCSSQARSASPSSSLARCGPPLPPPNRSSSPACTARLRRRQRRLAAAAAAVRGRQGCRTELALGVHAAIAAAILPASVQAQRRSVEGGVLGFWRGRPVMGPIEGDHRRWQSQGVQQWLAGPIGAAQAPCISHALAARQPCGPAPASQSVHRTLRLAAGPATMASREELEAEALKLFTGIGLAEKTAQ